MENFSGKSCGIIHSDPYHLTGMGLKVFLIFRPFEPIDSYDISLVLAFDTSGGGILSMPLHGRMFNGTGCSWR